MHGNKKTSIHLFFLPYPTPLFPIGIKMKDKQIIENKLETLLKEYRITEDRLKRLNQSLKLMQVDILL